MKTTSCYSVFYFSSLETLEKVKSFYIDNGIMEQAHHKVDEGFSNYYVLKDNSGNATDIFTSDKFSMKDGFFGLRVNVDNFDEKAEELMKEGYKAAFEPIDTDSSSFCIFLAPEGKYIPNVVVFSHNKRLNIISLFH